MGQFAIIQEDEGEWDLIAKEALDRETKDRYTLKVTATDGKSEAPVIVEVHVLDINDNSPLCEQVRKDMKYFTLFIYIIFIKFTLSSSTGTCTHRQQRGLEHLHFPFSGELLFLFLTLLLSSGQI